MQEPFRFIYPKLRLVAISKEKQHSSFCERKETGGKDRALLLAFGGMLSFSCLLEQRR